MHQAVQQYQKLTKQGFLTPHWEVRHISCSVFHFEFIVLWILFLIIQGRLCPFSLQQNASPPQSGQIWGDKKSNASFSKRLKNQPVSAARISTLWVIATAWFSWLFFVTRNATWIRNGSFRDKRNRESNTLHTGALLTTLSLTITATVGSAPWNSQLTQLIALSGINLYSGL